MRPEATQGIGVLREAKGMKKVRIPVFDVVLCCKRRNPPDIAACWEGCSERMGNGCIESLGQLVDIGLNLSLAPSESTPILINSLSSHLSHAISRLQLIVMDGESVYAGAMSKVFAGVDGLIDHALGVTRFGSSAPHYRSKKAALALRSRPSSLQTIELIERMRSQILANLEDPDARWRVMGGSWENWRWKKNLKFTPRADVDEKTVEKLIATDCGDCWVNQVPTASGLLDKASETHCNIDLVKKTANNSYEFIELKYEDATPLFAAFEILKYAMLLLISRDRLN